MMLLPTVNVLMISYSQYLSVPYTSISSNQLTSDLAKHIEFNFGCSIYQWGGRGN